MTATALRHDHSEVSAMIHRHSGFKALAIGLGLIIFSTLAVHFMYAVWPWPNAPRGFAPLKETVATERARVEQLANRSSIELIGTTNTWTYRIVFEWTGLDSIKYSVSRPPTENSTDEIARRMAVGTQDLIEILYWSVQLIGLRIGVLIACLPLIIVAAIGGAIDGSASWFLRRTSVGRESGFIYHRAKFGLWIAMFSLWGIYLIPPIALDPLIVIPPFIAIFALAIRFSVSWFKKYI
jgi:integrating conjugative element membrane protein (TIGR03747 family)